MFKPVTRARETIHKAHLDSLKKFLSCLSRGADFNLDEWLKTLETCQLRSIERDALRYYDSENGINFVRALEDELIDVALIAYTAEKRFTIDTDDAREFLDSLLIGLAVAACIERLRRLQWLILTSRIEIMLAEPRPYRVTQRGLVEGAWSHAPLTLWVLGTDVVIH